MLRVQRATHLCNEGMKEVGWYLATASMYYISFLKAE